MDQLESLCATSVDGVVVSASWERGTDSVVWVLERHFQKTWPCCSNGHHFTVQHLRFSVEESAGRALLETVSGGLLWSVKPEGSTGEREKKALFQHISSPPPRIPALYQPSTSSIQMAPAVRVLILTYAQSHGSRTLPG